MSAPLLRQYGEAGEIKFVLRDRYTNALLSGQAFAVDDVQVSTNNGNFADADNRLTIAEIAVNSGIYVLTLSAAELLGARIEVRIEDQDDPQLFTAQSINIETFGDADAQYTTNFENIAVQTRTEIDNNSTRLATAAGNLTYIRAASDDIDAAVQVNEALIRSNGASIQSNGVSIRSNGDLIRSNTVLLQSNSEQLTTINDREERVHPSTFVRVRGFDSATGLRRS